MTAFKLFAIAFKFMLGNEGGHSKHKRDKGGVTYFGVSRRWHPIVYMKLRLAKTYPEQTKILYDFYYKKFWNKRYENIKDYRIAVRLFDIGVNIHPKKAVKCFQKACNEFVGDPIKVDGKFGNFTLQRANSLPQKSLHREFQRKCEEYYRSLEDFDVFGKGWLNRLNKIIRAD